jgi:hypothetical protein
VQPSMAGSATSKSEGKLDCGEVLRLKLNHEYTRGLTPTARFGDPLTGLQFRGWPPSFKCLCATTELNLPHTSAGAAFEGCASGFAPELAAVVAKLTRLDLSRGSTPVAAADAAALIGACTSLRWLGAPAVRQPGESLSDVIPATM